MASDVLDRLIDRIEKLGGPNGINNRRDINFNDASFCLFPFQEVINLASTYNDGDIKTSEDVLNVLKKIQFSLSKDGELGGTAELYFVSVAIGRSIVIHSNDGTVIGYNPILRTFIDENNISRLNSDNGKVIVHHKGDHFQVLARKINGFSSTMLPVR